MIGIWVLAHREVLRFVRQPVRLFGSLVQPLLFWLFMGAGFSQSFSMGSSGVGYREFFFPGIVLMLMLFAAIFSTITLIEDRNAGFLQGVLVAPVSRLSLVLGKVAGGTVIAMVQAVIFLCFAPLAGIPLTAGMVADLLVLFFLIGMGFTGMGFAVAWLMDSTAGYHAVMSVVMIPLWLISGALFPVEGASEWLAFAMRCNPVFYAQVLVRKCFYQELGPLLADADFVQALMVSVGWGGLMLAVAVWIVYRRPEA
ncbi:MAG: multidrug ABC transporter permease [Candidatus Latescibacteria bacterium]|nr:multidrug ABC transporter permease [Candidatus Latescibacterota bacterium]